MTDKDRYLAAIHAMQTGVAYKMNYDPQGETTPKHLRVGVNSALCNQAGLVKILLDKGILTLAEYEKAMADQMEIEAESYRKWLQEKVRNQTKIELH